MNLAENKNSFPSKIMEYLASGRRIISTKFVGYERFEGVICFCETDVSDIRLKMLEEIEGFKEDIDLYVKQKELSKTFDWKIQVERIINTIKS